MSFDDSERWRPVIDLGGMRPWRAALAGVALAGLVGVMFVLVWASAP